MKTDHVRAAYVHWPFCQRKCAYCDFISWPAQTGQSDDYTHWLLNEIAAVSAWSRQKDLAAPLTSVFFGGGTPSLADPEQLISILDALKTELGLDLDAEVTLEANPGTVDAAALHRLRAAGFNRISFGLQAAQDRLLETLGRIHTRADFVASVYSARTAGFDRISVDLMLGLPGQTLEDVADSLDLIVSLGIDHVSYYSLIIEPETEFADRYANHPERLPDDDTERVMYQLVRDQLADRGILPYEISNSARPGQECRHNLVYWQGLPYYGFGVAAHSFLDGVRRGNTESWQAYSRAWCQPAEREKSEDDENREGCRTVHKEEKNQGWPFLSSVSAELIDRREAQKEVFLLGLRLSDGVNWSDFQTRFGCDARDIFAVEFARLQRQDLLFCDERGARLTRRGLDFANQAFAEFV